VQQQSRSVVASSTQQSEPPSVKASPSFETSLIPLGELLEISRRLKGYNPFSPQGWDAQAEAPILDRPFV
jgi:hypothetical protein